MGAPGSVSWQFHHRGVIAIDGLERIEKEKGKNVLYIDPYDVEKVEMDAMDFPIEDVCFEGDVCVVTCSKEDYMTIDK